jgi:hypothetical protein
LLVQSAAQEAEDITKIDISLPAWHGTGKLVPDDFLLNVCRTVFAADLTSTKPLCFFNADGKLRNMKDVDDEFAALKKEVQKRDKAVKHLLGTENLYDADDTMLVPLLCLFLYIALEPRSAHFTLGRFAAGDLGVQDILSVNTLASMRVYTAWLLMGKPDVFERQWTQSTAVLDDYDTVEQLTRNEWDPDHSKSRIKELQATEEKMRSAFEWCKPSRPVKSEKDKSEQSDDDAADHATDDDIGELPDA